MPADRYYVDAPLEKGSFVPLEENEKHHLISVMRGKVGDPIELVNGKGVLAYAKITKIDKRVVEATIEEVTAPQVFSFPIILCQAIPRMNRLDTIIEKGTELGMTELWLFPGEKSERVLLSEQQKKRFSSIAVSAMKQCGRLDLPLLRETPLLAKWKQEDLLYPAYFGDLSPEAPPFLEVWKKEKGILFFVGPEAGFSESERDFFHRHAVQGVHLHPHILRTDTASLVALSLISSKN